MTQVCTVLEALRVAQAEVIRATVPEEAKGVREHFYDAAAAYDESHGDDVRHPTCRMCAEALGDDDDEFRTWLLDQLSESPTVAELMEFAQWWDWHSLYTGSTRGANLNVIFVPRRSPTATKIRSGTSRRL